MKRCLNKNFLLNGISYYDNYYFQWFLIQNEASTLLPVWNNVSIYSTNKIIGKNAVIIGNKSRDSLDVSLNNHSIDYTIDGIIFSKEIVSTTEKVNSDIVPGSIILVANARLNSINNLADAISTEYNSLISAAEADGSYEDSTYWRNSINNKAKQNVLDSTAIEGAVVFACNLTEDVPNDEQTFNVGPVQINYDGFNVDN